jgi:Arc/MetJ-type ribon-helix-helix transcriptional regulator
VSRGAQALSHNYCLATPAGRATLPGERGFAMTINLPDDLARFIQAEVHRGHFASEEDALSEAVRLLRRRLSQSAKPTPDAGNAAPADIPDPVLGFMRDATDEMDDIVAEAMRHREQQPWRLPSSD